MTKHDDWLVAAENACSFRRMYALATEILNESDNPGVRCAAARVVEVLEGVIDLPIASAKQLQRSRQRFARLMDSVGNSADYASEPG
ncbi:MAG: hypothetical protein EON58_14790 [Alphaproteobacteria bacterium]|nr:MAG: hypothetical protein EON58_14790 [Alphaproteobacteria bacterium]